MGKYYLKQANKKKPVVFVTILLLM